MYRKPGIYKHWDFEVLDLLVLEFSFVFAYFLRNGSFAILSDPRSSQLYTSLMLIIILASAFSATALANHKDILRRGRLVELSSVFTNSTVISALLILYLFLTQESSRVSRLIVGYFYLLSIVFVYAERLIYKHVLHERSSTGYGRRRVILISATTDCAGNPGQKEEAGAAAASGRVNAASPERIRKWVRDMDSVLDVAGIVLTDRPDLAGGEYEGAPVLCSLKDLPDRIRDKWIDEVFILLSPEERSSECVMGVLQELAIMGITLHTILNVSGARSRATVKTVESIGDDVVLTESIGTITGWQLFLKRVLDIIGACVGLIFTGIFTVIFGPVIFFTDPGPIFYSQERVGKNGRIFRIYKFRTMYRDADARKKELMAKNEMNGLMFKMKDDPRILGSGPDGKKHGIGWLLRSSSIDEFPQFFNVLIGNMSLVGTRPPTKDEWSQYESRHRARMAVRPGITGLWQASGRSDIKDFDEVIRLDLEYINRFSLAEDIRILWKTVMVVLKHEGAE